MEERVITLKAGESVTIMAEQEVKPEPAPVPDDLGEVRYKVGLISDVHFDVEDTKGSEYAEDLKNACEVFVREGCEFVASAGDFAQYNDGDYAMFKDWYGAHGYAKGLRLYTVLGNHDYLRLFHVRDEGDVYADDGVLYNRIGLWGNVGEFHNIRYPKDGKYESDIRFFEHGLPWNGEPYTGWRTSKGKLNYWIERHGDIYAFISVDYGKDRLCDPWDTLIRGINLLDYDNEFVKKMTEYVSDTKYDREKERKFDYQYYDPEVLMWLKGLAEGNRDKLVFVVMHHFMPNGAGDTFGEYSRLRIWPVPETMEAKRKYYAGSNTVSGLTFWFLDKLLRENPNIICITGHSHYEAKAQEDRMSREYEVRQPDGTEVMPLVDSLETLKGTEYDYKLYQPVGHSVGDTAVSVHLPSLSKPVSREGKTLYGASQGAIMEVCEKGVRIVYMAFKDEGEKTYKNEIVKEITINR